MKYEDLYKLLNKPYEKKSVLDEFSRSLISNKTDKKYKKKKRLQSS